MVGAGVLKGTSGDDPSVRTYTVLERTSLAANVLRAQCPRKNFSKKIHRAGPPHT